MASCGSIIQDSGDNEINIVLLGKTGNGKSSSGNTILRRNAFLTSDKSSSMTKLSTLECSQNELTSLIINVVDTPGLMDTDGDDTMSIIGQGMSLCPRGFNAVIIVVRYGITFTREEEDCIKILKHYLGPTILQDFGIIIMTHGDSFKSNNKNVSFNDWCRVENQKDKFGQLLAECNGKCVLFFNKGKNYEEDRRKSVSDLFYIITSKSSKRYRCHSFDAAIESRKVMLEKLDMPVLHKLIQEKLSLIDEQLNKNIKSGSLEFENLTNRTKELLKIITDLPDSPELKTLKANITLMVGKIDDLKAENDVQVRRRIQREMKKNLRILKNPPSMSPVVIANVKLIFAKILYPVGTVCSLGFAADFLRNLVFEQEINYDFEVRFYDKQMKRFDRAKESILIHQQNK